MIPVWGLPEPLPAPPPPPRRAEVVIVGAGITGVSLLRWLLDRNVDAIVVERDLAGSGASGRNAGFLLAGVAENYAAAVRRYGRSTAAEVWAFTLENHALIRSTPGIEHCEYRCGGSWTVAVDGEEAAALDESAVLLAEDGFDGHLLTDPPPPADRVLVNARDGEVDPLRLVRALAQPVSARLHERTEAVAVEDGDRSATVHLRGGGVIDADLAVLATNAWTSELLPAVHIRPVRAQMLAADDCGAAIPCPVYADRGHSYWRRRSDGTVLVGGFRNRALAAEVGFDLTPTPAVQRHLDAQLIELGGRGTVSARWSGTMGFSDDGLPLVGSPPGARHVAVCAGYTGHGMGFAMSATRHLSSRIIDGTPLPRWLDAARPQLACP